MDSFVSFNGYEVCDAKARTNIEYLNYITPQMFGAIADGYSDDSNSIHKAIQYAVSNNKILYFPKGTYLISDYVSLCSNIHLIGSYDTIITGAGFNTIATGVYDNITIENLTFALSGENRTTIFGVNNLTLTNLRFINCSGFGLYDVNNFIVDNISMNNTILGFSLYRCNYGILSNFKADNVTEVVDLAGCTQCSISNVVATDITRNHVKQDEVIDIGQSENITISNVHCNGHYRGILLKNEYVAGIDNKLGSIHIENCVFENIAGSGIGLFIKDVEGYTEFFNKEFYIKNVTIKSNDEYSRGILINNYSEYETNTFDIIDIDGVYIDVKDYAITAQVTNPRISLKGSISINNSYLAGKTPIGLYSTDRGCNILNSTILCIADNVYTGRIRNSKNITIRDCNIYSGSGILFEDCLNVNMFNNHFIDTSKTPVSFSYSSDSTSDLLNIVICNNLFNDVSGYGSALQINNKTHISLKNIKFENNNIFIKEDVSAYGVLLVSNTLFYGVVLNGNCYRNLTVFTPSTTINNVDSSTFINTNNVEL